MPISVRPATGADSVDAVRIIRAVYDEYGFPWYPEGYHEDLYDLDRFYARAGHGFWMAEVAGKAMGTVALHRYPLLPGKGGETIEWDGTVRAAGTDCSLERMYVLPEARRMKVGTALLEAVLASARSECRRAMEIWSDKRFEAAHRMYERCGAAPIGERLCHDPEQSPEWGFVLTL